MNWLWETLRGPIWNGTVIVALCLILNRLESILTTLQAIQFNARRER